MENVCNNRLYLLVLASFQQGTDLVINASKYRYSYFLGASVSTARPPVRMLADLRPPEPLVSGHPPGLPRHFRPSCPDFGASSRLKIVKRRPDSRLGYLGAFQGSCCTQRRPAQASGPLINDHDARAQLLRGHPAAGAYLRTYRIHPAS